MHEQSLTKIQAVALFHGPFFRLFTSSLVQKFGSLSLWDLSHVGDVLLSFLHMPTASGMNSHVFGVGILLPFYTTWGSFMSQTGRRGLGYAIFSGGQTRLGGGGGGQKDDHTNEMK